MFLTNNGSGAKDSNAHSTTSNRCRQVDKLYGHGYEVFALAASHSGDRVLSACVASSPAHAAVLVWDPSTWKLAATIPGHNLTVVQMEFSPDDRSLLSVSRDRHFCLYAVDPTAPLANPPAYVSSKALAVIC